MGVLDRKTQLFTNIVHLRSASREVPDNRDIAAVRVALEEELGATVSQRLAASLLGLSHTALRRWIIAGDLAVVQGIDGRTAVPVAELLDLYDAVERERTSGRRGRHLLEPVMLQGRRRAEQIVGSELVAPDPGRIDGHRRAEMRSLAYHRALARHLSRPMVDEARYLLWKWRGQGKLDDRYADRWEEVLWRPLAEIRSTISEDSLPAADLRQNSPFAGMLSEPERRKIIQEVV